MNKDDLVLFQMMATMTSDTNDLFNSHEMEEGRVQFVDPTVGVRDVLGTMQATPALFKTLTNFTLHEFDELVSRIVLTIRAHAGSMGELQLSYFMFSILIFKT
jgi:hypothetical protein